MRELVHDPMKTVSTAMSRIAVPACRPMYASARRAESRESGSSNESGPGTTSSMLTDWAGFVPHVTVGRIDAASSTSSLSKRASASVTSDRQSSRASFPLRALRRELATFEVGERRVVGRDHPGTRARLDRHVADGHPPFHRQIADGGPAVLDDGTDAAGGAETVDDREDDVLRSDAHRGARRRP